MLTVRDIATCRASGSSSPRARPARQPDPLCTSRAARPDAVARGRRAPDHDRARRRRALRPQREYVRRLAAHGLAGLAFGIGFGWAEPPAALADEAERLDFPLVTVPYEVPFIALTKAISSQLANAQLARPSALEVHERLAQSVLQGQGAAALLAILGDHVGCALALVDEAARRRRAPRARLDGRARARAPRGCRRRDLVAPRRQAARRPLRVRPPRAPPRPVGARLELAAPRDLRGRAPARGRPGRGPRARPAGRARDRADRRLRTRPAAPLRGAARRRGRRRRGRGRGAHRCRRRARPAAAATFAQRDPAAFLVATDLEEDALAIAREIVEAVPGTRVGVGRPAIVEAAPGTRVGVGRPASGSGLGRSLLERAPPSTPVAGPVASYQDLGSLELLLSLPGAARGVRRACSVPPPRTRGCSSRLRRSSTPAAAGASSRPARRAPAHAALPDGPAPQADRTASRRPVAADGALARRQGETSPGCARGGARTRMRTVWFTALHPRPSSATICPCPRPW